MDKLTQFRIKKNARVGVIAFLCALLIFAVAAGVLFGVNRCYLCMDLQGDWETLVDYGEEYQEPGYETRLVGTFLFRKGIPVKAKVVSEDDINTDVLGNYKVIYRTKWLFWEGLMTRSIRVVDRKAPVITLQDSEDWLTVVNEPYKEEGFTAVDEYDGDLTDRVTSVEENGVVTYRVSDHSGNEAVVQRTIRYHDPIAPQLTLTGGSITLNAGEAYTEPGYAAWDNGDGDITEWVEIFTDLNPYLAGTYKITYTVNDTHGNITTVYRNVEVKALPRVKTVMPKGKTIYLTFDDGPTKYTADLLKVLKKHNVKATFFVCDTEDIELLPQIVKQGHSIGVHSESHNYQKIYASCDAYFDDMLWMRKRIYETTGVETNLIRFPGGSSNTVSTFNPGIMTTLTQAVEDCGYTYFDWNVNSKDAEDAKTADDVYKNVTKGIKLAMEDYGYAVVLQHDTKDFSVEAVERIIKWGKKNGYTFRALQESSPGAHLELAN